MTSVQIASIHRIAERETGEKAALWGSLWKEIMSKNRGREIEKERESEGASGRERERLSQTSMAALCKWLTSPDVKLNRETLMSCVYLKSLGPTPQDCERQIP